MSDDFLKNLREGSETAFKELIKAHRQKVIGVCFGFLRNQEDSEDTAQETFIEVFRSIKKFKGESSISTWIYRIAVTKSLDFLKAKKRGKRLGFVSKIFSIEEADEFGLLVSGMDSSKEFDENQRSKVLLTALSKMPESQRIALTLSKLDGFSNPEISEIMQTSVSGVESLVHRGKESLKQILNKFYSEYLK